jgi:hypothetical protein
MPDPVEVIVRDMLYKINTSFFLYHAPSLEYQPFYAEKAVDGYRQGKIFRQTMRNKDSDILDGVFMILRHVAGFPETHSRTFLTIEAAAGNKFWHIEKDRLFFNLNEGKCFRRYS